MVRSGRLTPQRLRHWLKMANLGSLELLDLTVYGACFEQTVEIFSNQNKGQDFAQLKKKLPSSTT